MARKRQQPHHQATLNLTEALNHAYQHWSAGHAEQAEILCQRILVAWPGQADALHLLGLMAHAYGNLDLALEYLRQACLAPRAPGLFFRNLTEMCRQRGLLEEGEQAGRRAVALEPGSADGWNNLGIVLQESGKIEESLDCLRRALDFRPADPQTLNNLGNSFRLAGKADQAEHLYRLALEYAPEYAQAHSNLSALCAVRGDFEAGIEHAKAALACEPQFADAYLNLADIENTRHNRREALRWIDALLAFAPNHIVALGLRARILLQAGHPEEALVAASRAVLLAPDDGGALNRQGEVMLALNRTDEALELFQRAAQRPGRHVEDAQINRAILLQQCGRAAEAAAQLDTVLARFPNSSRALATRADGKTFQPGDPDIDALEKLVATPELFGFARQLNAHFALGKAYLDLDDGAQAFVHLEAGNRLKRSTFAYDPGLIHAWVDEIVAAFPTLITAVPGAPDSGRPVFIVGMPRSGTTLVEQILASHPQFAGAGELPTLRQVIEQTGQFPNTVAGWTDEAWRRIGTDYLRATHQAAAGKSHLIDKMPSNFLYAGIIARALPNARIIHCRRDPMDTCLSCYSKNFAQEHPYCYDQRELGLFYRDYRKLMAHWRSVLPADRMIEVDYEAMVDDQEGQTRRILSFLGQPWDDACLHFYRTKRVVHTASDLQVRQPIYRHAVGRWHAYSAYLGPLREALGDEAQ
jgi:tetratricopeptide (TPR) repeat protein